MIWDFIDILTRRLLLWSILSILSGVYFWVREIPFWQGLGLQTVVWGGVVGLVALFGRRGLDKKIDLPVDLIAASQEAARLRRLLWINTGLDCLYLTAGLALAVIWGPVSPFINGNAWGIVFQAGFLLLFDFGHALTVPDEIFIPDMHVFIGSQYEDFWLEGGQPAAIVVHGFPGTPDEMRSFAEELHQQGWSVRGLLLPGHGAAITSLFQQRIDPWVESIRAAVQELKQHHSPVLLVGYSMGGGLSVLAVAGGAHPDALVLIAPFWLYQPPWSRGLIGAARLFLPFSFAPLPRLNISEDMLKQALHELLPDLDFESPEMRAQIEKFRAPMVFFEQFRRMGVAVENQAGKVSLPTLVIQGDADPVVRPTVTQRLIRLLDGPVRYQEVQGKHEINIPGNPGHSQALAAVLQYAEDLRKKETPT